MKKSVVQVLGRLDRGGAEMWLSQLNEQTVSSNYHFIFLTLRSGKGYLDQQVLDNGAEIVNIPLSDGLLFYYRFYKFLKNRKVEILHSHVLNFSGIILFLGYLAGVKKRIAHSHSDKSEINSKANFFRRKYIEFTTWLLNKFSTSRIACSDKAGKSLFETDYVLLDNGINFKRFPLCNIDEKKKLKEELEIDNDTFIIGHVGRYSYPKNHKFIVEIAKKLNLSDRKYTILLVGEGELFGEIKEKVEEEGLTDIIKMLGARDDIPNLMTNLFDLMIFPSFYEGMPLTLIESQKSNLGVIISDTIPRDVIKIKELFQILPIDKGAELWQVEIENHKVINRDNSKDEEILKDFSIETSFKKLINYY